MIMELGSSEMFCYGTSDIFFLMSIEHQLLQRENALYRNGMQEQCFLLRMLPVVVVLMTTDLLSQHIVVR